MKGARVPDGAAGRKTMMGGIGPTPDTVYSPGALVAFTMEACSQ